ncbi:hypothetical protein LJC37_05050 [Bacteroidales bacterium OttesenSCG-928-E04]|nr:hypothetical protein [Bacteroidales bacterium OttesenSCG-928-E04]
MECIYCSSRCIKSGKKRGIQCFRCKSCGKTQKEEYSKLRISEEKCDWVRNLTLRTYLKRLGRKTICFTRNVGCCQAV